MIGEIIREKYRVTELLSRGGMSDIYLAAEITRPKKIWAVKLTQWDISDPELDTALFRRFQVEGRLLSRLRHPMLPRLKEYFRENERHFIIREYFPGENLEQLLKEEMFPLASPTAAHWGVQACGLLEYLHGGIPAVMAGDLTLSNLILAQNPAARSGHPLKGDLKMVDLGIADFLGEKLSPLLPPGTPGYTAPELLKGGNFSPQSDIYSLGVCLYRLVTKNFPPREGPNGNGHWPGWDEVFAKSLAADPSLRYQSAGAMKLDLLPLV